MKIHQNVPFLGAMLLKFSWGGIAALHTAPYREMEHPLPHRSPNLIAS